MAYYTAINLKEPIPVLKRNHMIHQNLQAIILAAGKSSRFKTGRSKFLSTICGEELILYPIKALAELAIPTVIILSTQSEEIKQKVLNNVGDSVTFIDQMEQNGTADAVATSKNSWFQDHILIMHGDLPLVTSELVENFNRRMPNAFLSRRGSGRARSSIIRRSEVCNIVDVHHGFRCSFIAAHFAADVQNEPLAF